MNRKSNVHVPSKYLLLIVTLLCAGLIMVTYFVSAERVSGPLRTVANYTVIPMQKGVSQVGTWLSGQGDYFLNLTDALEENERLKEENDELKQQNSQLLQNRYEWERFEELLEVQEQDYSAYESVAARVFSKDSGNWFNMFLIDKGYEDGIQKDNNVVTAAGLVGIVVNVGPNWAQVRSIIDDSSSVYSMMLSSSEPCVVRGDLQLMNDGVIRFEQLQNNESEVEVGEAVMTANTSTKFLPGILAGYVSEVEVDASTLTRSGKITPVVDFNNIQEVLVIKTLKQDVDVDEETKEDKSDKKDEDNDGSDEE